MTMRLGETFLEPAAAMANVGRARIARAIREPQRNIAAAGGRGDIDAIEDVLQGRAADGRIGIAERAVFVNLVLKDVRVDGADFDAIFFSHAHDFGTLDLPSGKSKGRARPPSGSSR